MLIRVLWWIFQRELFLSPDARFSKVERLTKAAVTGRCYCMWQCLPQTLDTNISCPEAGFSWASEGAIWDVQNTWDRFAGLMDMTQYLQEIQVLWEQQWEAISKGMDTWNKQHLWGIQRFFYLLLFIHIPWCPSGGGEADGFSLPLLVHNPEVSKL